MEQPAVSTPTPPPLAAERHPSPPPPLFTLIKQEEETHQLAVIPAANPLPSEQPSQQPQPPQALPSPAPIPHFINSIDELRGLSAALSAFHSCFDDLQTHLHSLQSAIDSELASPTPPSAPCPPPQSNIIVPLNEPALTPPPIPSEENENQNQIQNPVQSELEGFCLTMSSRGLRKYMVTNLGEANRLREEVPKALKLANNPARLVLDCVGRFFLQGSKAYIKGSQMIPARDASVLILECFLLGGGDAGFGGVDEVKEEAGQGAIAWRKRLINEGGLAKACEIDARGLLMFVGCFGIPLGFRPADFRDLVRAGNVKEISNVLKGSSALVVKISDIVDSLLKTRMAVDAVDVAYTFGLEDKLSPQTILTSFLRESKEAWKRTKKSSQGSLVTVNDANKKHLSDLQSVIKCLERHKIDPSKFLSGWQISEKVLGLEKEIADFETKLREHAFQKRKADETESMKLKYIEVKRSRLADLGLPPQHATIHLDSHGHMDRSLASPLLLYGAGAGHGVPGAGVSGRLSTGAAYIGIYGEAPADTGLQAGDYGGQPYALHGDAAAYTYSERPGSHTFGGQPPSYGVASLYRPSSSLEGYPSQPSSSTVGVASRSAAAAASDLYQFADIVADGESYPSNVSRATGAVAPAVPTHHISPQLY